MSDIPTRRSPCLAIGRAGMAAEEIALRLFIFGVPRFRDRHPLWYGVLAFVIGGGVVALFTMSTYAWWVHYPIDVVTAVYQMIAGGLGGGIATVILAFAAASTLRTCHQGRGDPATDAPAPDKAAHRRTPTGAKHNRPRQWARRAHQSADS
jgi:hypothetical protein